MSKVKTEYWLGNEESVSQYVEMLKLMQDPNLVIEARSALVDKTQEVTSPLLDVQGSLGVIDIKGSLLSYSNEITRWLGYTGYPDIREALIEAANNPDIKDILLNIDSPGGAANGVEDISTLISRIRTEYKPVHAFTSGTMASAAYWIGVSAETVQATRMSSVGSIGVIATHFEVSKQLEQDGVTATVFRAGEVKALGGPYEQLTDKAKTIIQAKLDTLYSEFVSHVAMARGTTAAIVQDKMADGKEFFGFEALQAGLIDGIATLDQAVSKLSSKDSPMRMNVSETQNINMEIEPMARKKILDEKAVAIIAAGGTVDAALEESEVTEDEASTETATEVKAAAPEVEAPAPEVEAPATEVKSELVSYLQSEIAALTEKNTQLMVDSRELKAKLDKTEANLPQLRAIAADVVNVRSIALGRSRMDLSTVSDEVLVQQYSQVTADFSKAFPVGGVALAVDTKPNVNNVPASHEHRVKAAKI